VATLRERSGELVVRSQGWESEFWTATKRGLDVIVSAVLLVLLSPVFLLLALLVKVTSRGPVLYEWKVVGKNGRPFSSRKFRSMVVEADQLKASLLAKNEMTGPMFKLSHDPRVTPVGAWMRRYSLDELPQLYSVLIGEMSLVGPRPPLQREYEHFTEYQKQKLKVKPGLTCLWQISGRNNIRDFDEWVSLDLQYIRNWSLWLDLSILAKTLLVVLSGSGK
jgi:lipopolysaccharide/colanic/teichoic acid biosynthesis glycosyltransferase